MSDIKRGANVAGTVPVTGPAAIRTTALLPGNRSSNMTTGTGPGSGSNRTGVGGVTSNSSHGRIVSNHMLSDSPQSSVPQGTIRLDASRHAGIIAAASSSLPSTSSQSQKTVSSIKHTTGSIPSLKLANNVGHDQQDDVISPSVMAHRIQSKGVISNAIQQYDCREQEKTSGNDEEGPSRKRLKIDLNAANAARDSPQLNSIVIRRHRISGESLLERRKRIQEHRKSRLQRLHKSYNQNATEQYFIQNHVPPGSLMDLQAFRKKPNLPFLNFLKANKAPNELLQEVALTVLGHTNPSGIDDENSAANSVSNAGKASFENISAASVNSSNVQTLTVKRPSSKPGLQQVGVHDGNMDHLFSPLNHCGRVTSAAMAQAIHLARKREANQSSQVLHPFSNLNYDASTHLNTANVNVNQDLLPPSQPSKFPPYSPKILSGSELGGVLYGPKLGFFPPSTSSSIALTLPTVPIAPTFHELQVGRINWFYVTNSNRTEWEGILIIFGVLLFEGRGAP